MKKIIILVEDIYEDTEFWYPYFRMKEAGFEVRVAGPEARTYTSKYGKPVEAGDIADNNPDEFHALIIPGGYAPDKLRRHKHVLEFVKKMNEQGKLIAAICHAGWVLASAGIMKDKKGTCYAAIKDDMVNAGMAYADEDVVVDGNLVTSRKPDDLPAFCTAILANLP